MIFDIVPIENKTYFVEPRNIELPYEAWQVLEMCIWAEFQNMSIACCSGYENALLIE